VPAAQSVQALHAAAPAADQRPPSHGAQPVAFDVAEKVPASHDAHVRSRVSLPASDS
jgi:hypothetical protein